jgi:hypothetical protein
MASAWVGILVDGDDMRAYVSRPETAVQGPGVSVITKHAESISTSGTSRIDCRGKVTSPLPRHYITA